MSKKMPKIPNDYFKMTVITCEIDDEECDECQDCRDCEKAIEYLTYSKEDEFNDMIREITPSTDKMTRNKYGTINAENTIAKYESLEAMFNDKMINTDGYDIEEHGYKIKTPIHYPRFYLLKSIHNIGIPSYYMFKDYVHPIIAVYPNAVYAIAPEYVDDDPEYQ